MQLVDPSAETVTAMTNKGFIPRWKRISARKKVQLLRRLHSDICNVPLYLPPGVRLYITLSTARLSFFLTYKSVDSKTGIKFLYAQLLVRRVRPNPNILLAHTSSLKNRGV